MAMNPKLYDFFVVVFTDGDLDFSEMKNEAQKENWAPILVLRHQGQTIVPVFRDMGVCHDFMRRNVLGKQLKAIVGMSEVDLKRFTDRGFKLDWHDFPKRYVDRPGYEVSLEVVETDFDISIDQNSSRRLNVPTKFTPAIFQ